jgi:hypothetical protein
MVTLRPNSGVGKGSPMASDGVQRGHAIGELGGGVQMGERGVLSSGGL